MSEMVPIDRIAETLNATVIFEGSYNYVRWVVASSLMSDVLTTDKEEILLVSNLTTSQVVRTADMVGANAILISNDKPIADDTIDLAKELQITLLRTTQPLFETCCILGRLFKLE
jgi:hypothetical protein